MIRIFRAAAVPVLSLLLASCVLEEPVFESNLARPDTALDGVWETVNTTGTAQHAALFPLNAKTSLLQYPVATNGWWFEAQSLKINGRDVLQLRILAGPEATPAKPGAKNHTLAWLETQPDGTVQMRTLDGQAIDKGKFTAASLREFLANPDSDWNTVFGTPTTFRRGVGKK